MQPFMAMEVFREANAYARSGADVIHLSVGQPAREAPPEVLARVAERMQQGKLGYTEASGIPELRERIARHYREMYNVSVAPERVFVTIGSSSAFLLSMLAAFDQGEEVAITLPCYPAYPNIMQALDLVPIFLRGTEESNFQPTKKMLESLAQKPQGIVIASPSNPAGTVLEESEMKAVAHWCGRNGTRIISDEIYHGITYGVKSSTLLSHTPEAIVINSFSKYFLLPGWRLGWAVVPESLIRSFEVLVQNFFISPSAIAQYAALEMFRHPEILRAAVAEYARNRAILLEELPKAGFTRLAPADGAFYLYADVSGLTDDSATFCREMLYKTGVAAVPGMDFDRERGNAYVRFSFSGQEMQIREAMRRLQSWLMK